MLMILSCGTEQDRIIILDPIQSKNTVRTGLDVLLEDYPDLLVGKTIGLVTNHTGISRNNKKNYKLLQNSPNIFLKKIFAPEKLVADYLSLGVRKLSSSSGVA